MPMAEAERRALALDAIKHAPRVRGDHAVLRALRAANEIESDPAFAKAGYNPGELRVPAGEHDGGEWGTGGGDGERTASDNLVDVQCRFGLSRCRRNFSTSHIV